MQGLDWEEPKRVADAAAKMQLKHVVLTSVNRDERKDGGAPIFAECHKELRKTISGVTIESLIPDFRGVWDEIGRASCRERVSRGVDAGSGKNRQMETMT